MVFSYIRLKKNPRNVAAPQGHADIYVDASGNVVVEFPGGGKTALGGSSTATSGDFESTSVGGGFIAKSPDGTRWRLTPDNDGASVWTAL